MKEPEVVTRTRSEELRKRGEISLYWVMAQTVSAVGRNRLDNKWERVAGGAKGVQSLFTERQGAIGGKKARWMSRLCKGVALPLKNSSAEKKL